VPGNLPRLVLDTNVLLAGLASKSSASLATHIITLDADLLSLPTSRNDAGKRFRQRLRGVKIQKPVDFLTMNDAILGS